jgi:hypothetical protein
LLRWEYSQGAAVGELEILFGARNPHKNKIISFTVMMQTLPTPPAVTPLPSESYTYSFKVHLHNVQVKLVNPKQVQHLYHSHHTCYSYYDKADSLQLVVNFANFKSFVKRPLSIVDDHHKNSKILDWELDRQFVYETRNIPFIKNKFLSFQLYSTDERNEASMISELKTDLFTLICGPRDHELEFVDIKNENVFIGTITYNLIMEQVNEVQLCLKSVNLSMNMPCECSLIYQLTGKKDKNVSY